MNFEDLVSLIIGVLIGFSLFCLVLLFQSLSSNKSRKAILIEKELKDQIWYVKYEVKVIAESETAYKIKRNIFSKSMWIPKKAIGLRLDFIK